MGNWDEFVRSGGWDTGARPPMALGVEASGIVTAAGSRLAGLAAQGALTVSVARPLALEQAGQALAQVRHGTRGPPVILRPAGPR